MKKVFVASAFLLAALAVSGAPAMAQKMHKATVEIGMKKANNGQYYVVKMNGKMYGMIPLSSLEKLYSAIDMKHQQW